MLDALRLPETWFAALLAMCIVAPYLLGVRPRTRAQWIWVAVTVALLAWLLPMMGTLRSR